MIGDTLTFPAMAFKARAVFAFMVFSHFACFRVCSKVMMTSNDTEDMSHLLEFYGDIKKCNYDCWAFYSICKTYTIDEKNTIY